ncbi:hypothetical protein FJZ36_05760 [Candidatus Poribacteria bacterium]|nr:hypothetical protein [Candidatus Poribacteria bacterium]
MRRHLTRLPAAFALVAALSGCSGALKTLFAPQELSDNYAQTPGTTAVYNWQGVSTPAPAIIDGDAATFEEMSREIEVRLPEPRPIRRIVIRNTNFEDVIVYVGGPGGEGDWKIQTQIRQNKNTTITIPLSLMTDRIRFRIGGTLDDSIGPAQPIIVEGIEIRRSTLHQARPKAGEVEIYGFRTKREADDVF